MREDDIYRRFDLGFLKSEEKTAHERKISEAVFDHESLMALYDLVKRGAFSELRSIVSTGKEASVFLGVRGGEEVAVKIYLVETSDFRHMSRYIRGDPRFTSWRNRRQLVYMWAQKEYKNLHRVYGKVACPQPLAVHNNVLVMEFLGEGGNPAPRLKDVVPRDPSGYFNSVLGYLKEMFRLRLVHADLSEYNILDWCGRPYIIDFSAGVLIDHPEAGDFLRRDVCNIVNYFRRLGVKADCNEVLGEVLGDS